MCKVGDIVKVINLHDIEEPFEEDYPEKYLNKKGIITGVFEDMGTYPYSIKFDNIDLDLLKVLIWVMQMLGTI